MDLLFVFVLILLRWLLLVFLRMYLNLVDFGVWNDLFWKRKQKRKNKKLYTQPTVSELEEYYL